MTKKDFKVSSGLKNIIGKELIIDDNVAVFELVKNSYDAYAKEVKIIFQNTSDEQKSKMLIIDNGTGMSSADIENKWLFVGYSDKKDEGDKVIKKGERFFAGAKGVGRFSCDRLGTILNLYTRKKGERNIHLLKVEWKKFEVDQKEMFQNISVDLSEIQKIEIDGYDASNFSYGTILEMYPLNSKWDEGKLRGLKKYLQRLINPSNPDDEKEFEIYVDASEYKETDKGINVNERINGRVKNFVFEKLGIKTTHISCVIDESSITTELVDKGERIVKIKEKNEKYPNLKNIKILVFYLNQAAKTTFSRIMGVQPIEYGSVFLYKNNFRIQPYGNKGDDWLELEIRKGQGYSRNLATREIMGRIELSGKQEEFAEVSSREGVQKTEAYYELKDFFRQKVLRPLERYVVEAIDWDRESGMTKSASDIKADSIKIISGIAGGLKDDKAEVEINPDLFKIMKDKQIEKFPNLIKNVEGLEKYVRNKKEKKYIKDQLSALKATGKRLVGERKELREELKTQEKEGLFLKKAVSTDKDIIINLNHTIENSSLTIEGIIDEINSEIKKNSEAAVLTPYIDRISLEVKKITTLAGIVSVANFNLKVATIRKDVVQYIAEYIGNVLGNSSGLKFQIENKETSFMMQFKPLEMAMVLDNFISNSKKAKANLVVISFEKKGKSLHIHIADDGSGISKEVARNLFKRGYTTTTGAGIGLYHIRSMVDGMGGSVDFVGNNYNKTARGACFEMVFR